MKLKIVRILIFAFIYIGVLIAQVNTESMRKENAAEGFENTLGFEFGFEKSDQEVMEIVSEYRIDYYSSGGLHTFLIRKYQL